jgi:nicotinamidase/pyrazinamidase
MAAYDDTTALIVLDVQNDFADPAGSLYVREGERVVPIANEEVGRALASGATVVCTQDWHPEVTPHFRKDGGIWPTHCVQQTWGAELHPDLAAAGERIRKGAEGEDGYSGFSVRDPASGDVRSTQLESILRDRGVARVVVCGLATDYCVAETVLDALRLGFAVTVLEDAIRAVDLEPGDGMRAIARMRDAGAEMASSNRA